MIALFEHRTTCLALSALLLSACAASGSSGAMAPPAAYASPSPAGDVAAAPPPAMPGAPAAMPMPAKGGAAAPTAVNAKTDETATRASAPEAMLIYTGDLQMETDADQIAPTIDRIIDVAESVGGRISARTDASVVVSVPSAQFRDAMTKMEPLGTVVHRSVRAQDVTEEFHDADVRLQNLRATRQRLQEFLAKAGNIPDTLTVERELERVAQEIDVLEGKVRFLKERAAFSQITIAITARPQVAIAKEPTAPPPPPRRLLDLPVEWFSQLGINHLLDLR
jgi:Domain of unknown function (DUF4349)